MKNYRNYEVNDFLNDDSFREWSRSPTGFSASFWEEWLVLNPDRAEIAKQAFTFLSVIQDKYTSDITIQELDEMVDRLMAAAVKEEERSRRILRWVNQQMAWLAVALISLLAGLGWWVIQLTTRSVTDRIGNYQRWERKANEGNKPITFQLSDGSTVTLEGDSRLWYPRNFQHARREVYLKGKASFDVARNEQKPFIVYTSEFITQVAGTRFLVHSCAQEGTATVTVKSGRVMVQPRHQQVNPTKVAMELTDNQQAVYFRDEARMEKVLVHGLQQTCSHPKNHI